MNQTKIVIEQNIPIPEPTFEDMVFKILISDLSEQEQVAAIREIAYAPAVERFGTGSPWTRH